MDAVASAWQTAVCGSGDLPSAAVLGRLRAFVGFLVVAVLAVFASSGASAAIPATCGASCPHRPPARISSVSSMRDEPSRVRPPPQKLPGWRRVFVDDFVRDLPLGSYCGDPAGFPARLASRWAAYPYPARGTPDWGVYCPQRTTSIHDGVMDIWLHTELVNGAPLQLIDAVMPKFGCCGLYGTGQLYGRYLIRFRSDTFDTYHASWLLWPTSGTWPADGEIDFPEGDFNSGMNAYLHWRGGTSAASQYAFPAGVPMGGQRWHTAMIDWLPTLCRFVLDGNVVAQTSNASLIPNTPMRFVIQNGGSFSQAPNDSTQGHVYIDWIAIYRPAEPVQQR